MADVWVVLACLGREPATPSSLGARVQAAVIDRIEPAVRRRLLDAFLAAGDRHAARSLLRAAADHRLADANVRDHERRAIENLVAEAG